MGDEVHRVKIPHYGMKVKLNHVYPEKKDQSVKPRLNQIPGFIILAIRYLIYYIKIIWQGRRPLMDYLRTKTGLQIYGAPIGGIGCGTIGRGFKGEFCRYQLRPGLYEYDIVSANQFIVTIQSEACKTVYQSLLSTFEKPKKCLSSWRSEMDGADCHYTALYPRAWTEFNIPKHNLRLTCRQVSPVIPHNYKDSCIPGAVFVWTIENNGTENVNVSITLAFKNGNGTKEDRAGGVSSETFEQSDGKVHANGVLIHQSIGEMACTYGISGRQGEDAKVTCSAYFDPRGSGEDIWRDLLEDGELDTKESSSHKTKKGEELGCAVCVKTPVKSRAVACAEFALVWDMPKIHFHFKKKEYFKFYTKWFGNNGDAAPNLCHFALANYKRWETEIEEWQKPILEDEGLPSWYKSALFNELYFVADGGSIWLIADDADELPPNDPRREYGRFAYLEGHEYRMYNTYDVHFYASFALAQLWPKLQAVLQSEICDTIGRADNTPRTHLYDGEVSPRKRINSVPHDIGDPDEEPFLMINAYPIHDVSEWRDLNLKFVLQTYRDFSLCGDKLGLERAWPNVCIVMAIAQTWDRDGDGLIENGGFPDQTFDSWVMEGPSAYCGGLWLGALCVTIKMAEIIGDVGKADTYSAILDKGKHAFEQKLWNGRYYNFDSSAGNCTSIMSDQLCGQWYLRACGFHYQAFPQTNVTTALHTIYENNVKRFNDGKMGAANGMTADGKLDIVTIQSEEMWVGVTYGLAALMIHENLVTEGFATAEGVYRTVYEQIGLGFETPEAIYANKCYRSIGYMRPLSIWAMQLAWDQRKKQV